MKIHRLAVKGRMCGVIITVVGGNVKILHHQEKRHRGEKLAMRTEHCALGDAGVCKEHIFMLSCLSHLT